MKDIVCFNCCHSVRVLWSLDDLRFCPRCGSDNIRVMPAPAYVSIHCTPAIDIHAPQRPAND
jgi:Zn finger protein HypA/HybF involved in hydrogenase expression